MNAKGKLSYCSYQFDLRPLHYESDDILSHDESTGSSTDWKMNARYHWIAPKGIQQPLQFKISKNVTGIRHNWKSEIENDAQASLHLGTFPRWHSKMWSYMSILVPRHVAHDWRIDTWHVDRTTEKLQPPTSTSWISTDRISLARTIICLVSRNGYTKWRIQKIRILVGEPSVRAILCAKTYNYAGLKTFYVSTTEIGQTINNNKQ